MVEESISIAEAKKRFSELVGQVAYARKNLVITKRGKPMARLVPVEKAGPFLADVHGWLDADDPFFETIDRIVADRNGHLPRVVTDSEHG